MKHKRTAAALCLGTLLAGALTGITLFLGRRQTVEMAQSALFTDNKEESNHE